MIAEAFGVLKRGGIRLACTVLGCGPFQFAPLSRLGGSGAGDLIVTRCFHCHREAWRGSRGRIEGYGSDLSDRRLLIDGQGTPYYR